MHRTASRPSHAPHRLLTAKLVILDTAWSATPQPKRRNAWLSSRKTLSAAHGWVPPDRRGEAHRTAFQAVRLAAVSKSPLGWDFVIGRGWTSIQWFDCTVAITGPPTRHRYRLQATSGGQAAP